MIEVITGTGNTVKLLGELTELPPTVTEMGPLLASSGALTTSWVAVAEKTVAGLPLNLTTFAEAVGLNPCP